MYHADTSRGTIWAYDYDVETGMTSNKRVFVKNDEWSPDGLCMDPDGNLLVAVFDGSRVETYSHRGERLGDIELPIPNVTSCDLAEDGTLFITTAFDGMSSESRAKAPLDALKALDAKPLHTLSVPDARTQASAADAARTVQRDKKISQLPEAKVATKDIAIPTARGALPARVYTPEGNGPFPVVLYFHGGGWVVADINTYDATPRALPLGAKAMVISADYHHAPESKFPAQHDDAWAAYTWTVENVNTLNGDASRIAVAGESAGANLATNVALRRRRRRRRCQFISSWSIRSPATI